MQKFLKVTMLFISVYLAAFMLLNPESVLSAGNSSINLCITSVIPALFPYLISSGLLSSLGAMTFLSRYLSPFMRPLFGVSGSGAAAFLLGSISGYPVGAVCVRDLYLSGECTKNEAERMLAFCNNSGPLFIISVVGSGFLGDAGLGRLLYTSHLLSAVLSGIILKTFSAPVSSTAKALPQKCSLKTEKPLQILGEVMDSSVLTMLKICGYIIFFSVLSKSLPSADFLPFLHGILEITGGISSIVQTSVSPHLKLALISFFTAFSGISVLFQVSAVTSDAGLSLKFYLIGKFLQGVLSFAITKILVSRLPNALDVFAKSAHNTVFASSHSAFFSSVSMLLFAFLVLLLLSLLSAFRHSRR